MNSRDFSAAPEVSGEKKTAAVKALSMVTFRPPRASATLRLPAVKRAIAQYRESTATGWL